MILVSRLESVLVSFLVSIHFISFCYAHSIIRLFVGSTRVRFVFVLIMNSIPSRRSSQTRLRLFRSSINVHLLYIRFWICCLPAALFRIISRADHSDTALFCIISRADHSDTHIDKTTPIATLREQLL